MAEKKPKKITGVRLPPAQKTALVEIAAQLSAEDKLGRTITLSDVVRAVLAPWLARGMDACLRDLRAGSEAVAGQAEGATARSVLAEQARLRLAERAKKQGRKPA